MNEKLKIPDSQARQRALAADQSFIVQAPAGSGKTELLTQRLLTLLAHVKHPEEIVAITFTRKAAHEMRERLLRALQLAQQEAPQAAHARHTWQLARKALQQDQQEDWQLLNNPNRLRIHTIDAFCASLTKQLPILSGFGAHPDIIDDAYRLYQQSARECLAYLDSDLPWSPAIATLLLHVDNLHSRAESLLAKMLACRDQWLPYLGYQQDLTKVRPILEQGLQQLSMDQLDKLEPLLLTHDIEELSALMTFAQQNLDHDTPPLESWDFSLADLPHWRMLAQRLLTKEGEWRKQVNKNHGFPAASSGKDKLAKAELKHYKDRMLSLLTRFSEDEALQHCLAQFLQLPDIHYSEQQWKIIAAMMQLLPNLAAQLMVSFQQQGVVDHIEIAQRALLALGDEEEPTNLALALDYRIQHLLIDEFQDTSSIQFRLLTRLTAGWQANDGHSLFLVGDPMQSIYRFRKAEVGLFLQASSQGIAHLPLETLTLCSNFRAQADIVAWLNQSFTDIFPANNDMGIGAIRYSPAQAILPASVSPPISVHPHLQGYDDEAHSVVTIIQQIQQQTPNASIAILVKARSHLREILPALQQADIAYHANEIESLIDKTVIHDLLALTQALLHPGNRLAWLSVLRAPWCGLLLKDIHTIAYQQQSSTLWQRLLNYQQLPLSDDGKQRCRRLVEIIDKALGNRRRQTLRITIEGTWLALGGPACLSHNDALQHAQRFFALLDDVGQGEDIDDWNYLHTRLATLSATTSKKSDMHVEIMTIHKAKGLEFDHVILPNLGASTRVADSQLLLWMERASSNGNHLLLAPMRRSQDDNDPMYHYLSQIDKQSDALENTRLLYVAATRAREQLHLLGSASCDKLDDTGAPILKVNGNSFLAQLWPQVEQHFIKRLRTLDQACVNTVAINEENTENLKRLSKHWRLPEDWQDHRLQLRAPHNPIASYDMAPQNTHPEHIGTLVHRLLQIIAEQNLQQCPVSATWIQYQLLSLGTLPHQVENAAQQVLRAIEYSLADERGRWILHNHQQAQNEYPISAVIAGKVQHFIVDRTLVDDNNQRWIIDYKTSMGETTELIHSYQPQLESYAQAFALLEDRPIQLGLYFPLLQHWYTWPSAALVIPF